MRLLSAAGNTLFIAALGTTAYFGYYTLRYNTSEMQDLIDQRKKPENEFPGSSVRPHHSHCTTNWNVPSGCMPSYRGNLPWVGNIKQPDNAATACET